MKGKTGWSVYGDPPCADKVMSYYDALDFISGDGTPDPAIEGATRSPVGMGIDHRSVTSIMLSIWMALWCIDLRSR